MERMNKMGLSLNVLKKPIGVVNYNIETDVDEEVELACFFHDERLLDLMLDVGEEQDVFIIFNQTQFKQLIDIAQQIDGGTFLEDKEYKHRYANETMLDFYKRWDDEHIVVYQTKSKG